MAAEGVRSATLGRHPGNRCGEQVPPSLGIAPPHGRGKILIVNLAKGKLGEGPAALLGSLLVSHPSLAAMEAADRPQGERQDFYLYADNEFHTFANLTLATMLSEVRKYRLDLVLAHQYLSQLEPERGGRPSVPP